MGMVKGILIAAAGGGVSALAALAFLAGSPAALVFVYVAPLPLFLVGLGLGPAAGMVAGASGVAVAGLTGGLVSAMMYGFVHALPACFASRQALVRRLGPGGASEWYPLGGILAWLSLLAIATLLASALAGQMLGSGTQALVASHLEQGFRLMVPQLAEAERRAFVDSLTPMFPGAVGASWVIMATVNGVLAQGVLARMGYNLRPGFSFRTFDLPPWASWPLVGAAAVALLGPGELQYLGRNGALIAAVPYFLLGVVVVHALARWRDLPALPLIVFYVVVAISDWAKLGVAALGVAEHWVGLRGRLSGRSLADRPDREESE
jgi:hypothetical protein